MLKLKTFYISVCCLLMFSACNKTEDSFDASAQLKIDDQIIVDYIAKNNLTKMVKHSSGIYYEIIAPGSGVAVVGSSIVNITYEGRLLNGFVFDSAKTPIDLSLSQVISGWQIGVPLIQKGGTIRLILPSFFAYGNVSPGAGIPENAVLDFNISLVNIR